MCVFCSIVEGSIPSKKVFENDEFLAILDIAQTTYGHTLVMPKKHYEDVLECPKDEFERLMGLVQDLAKQITKNLSANGFHILINTGAVSGQTVNHLHVHIIPRFNENDSINVEFKENKFDLDEVLNKIRAC